MVKMVSPAFVATLALACGSAFDASAELVDITAGGRTAGLMKSSNFDSRINANVLFDGLTDKVWASASTNTASFCHFSSAFLPQKKLVVKEYEFKHKNVNVTWTASNVQYSEPSYEKLPTAWVLEGSDGLGGDWVVLDERKGIDWSEFAEATTVYSKTFSFNGTHPCREYRFRFLESNGTTSNVRYSLAEIVLRGETPETDVQPRRTVLPDGSIALEFLESGTLTLDEDVEAEVLLVAGGGSGGNRVGGGGGAGGVIHREKLALTAGSYPVTVGFGGYQTMPGTNTKGENGEDTVFAGLTAVGGGAGASTNGNGSNGGSGGGAAYYNGTTAYVGGTATEEQGNAGGDNQTKSQKFGGGGGGAGTPGQAYDDTLKGCGGDGLPFSILGRTIYYAGGGSGNGGFAAALGGGGAGRNEGAANNQLLAQDYPAMSGLNGFGGGGGGSGTSINNTGVGGRGGSGIVIVRYKPAQLPSVASPIGEGGIVEKKTIGGKRYVVHTFNASGTLTLPKRTMCTVLMVGGGGAGGTSGRDGSGGGGGAGGLWCVSNLVVEAGTHAVTVGRGGTTTGESGTETRFLGYVMPGGGAGGVHGRPGADGGCGGGAGIDCKSTARSSSGIGRAPYGSNGGALNVASSTTGGGGGAGGPGGNGGTESRSDRPGDGGLGVACDITGEPRWYAGGGGGGRVTYAEAGLGGSGVGGNGAGLTVATDGAANTGSGGGGGRSASEVMQVAGKGADGVVIVRYELQPSGLILLLR